MKEKDLKDKMRGKMGELEKFMEKAAYDEKSQIYKILGHAFSSSCFLTSTLHLSSIFVHNAVLATLSRNG